MLAERTSFYPYRNSLHSAPVDIGYGRFHVPSFSTFLESPFVGMRKYSRRTCQRHPLSRATSLLERYSWVIAPVIWGLSVLHAGRK